MEDLERSRGEGDYPERSREREWLTTIMALDKQKKTTIKSEVSKGF